MPNRPYFSQVWAIFGAEKPYKTGEKTPKCQIDPILPPHTPHLPVMHLMSDMQPVDAGINEASITFCLNLLRTALLNNEITEEQSRHLSMLSLSTRSQTVGLWDCGTQTTDYGPAHVGTARQSPTNPYTNPVSASTSVSGRNKMPASVPIARQSGAAASTQTGDAIREAPVVAPAARRQGSRPPSDTAAAAAVAAAPHATAGRGVRFPAAAVEVFNLAADDSDQAAPAAEGPDARRRGPSRSRRGQSVAMSERIADSREEAGFPDTQRQLSTTTPGVKVVLLLKSHSPEIQMHSGNGQCSAPPSSEDQGVATPQGWWPFLEHRKTPSSPCLLVWTN